MSCPCFMDQRKSPTRFKFVPRLENLGLEELLPNGEITVYVVTWNMNCKDPPEDLTEFLPAELRTNLPELLVFGTQECTADKSWEIGLQRTLGPSHVLYHTTIKKSSAIRLAIFINRGLIWFCSEPRVETIVLSWSKRSTKGAVSISFELLGSTFFFIVCHLAAHEEHLEDRLEHIREITKHFSKDYETTNLGERFDYIFWLGDMNFRISRPRGEVLDWVSTNEFPLRQSATKLLSGEQLTETIQEGRVFKGYREAAITFPPTYKFDPGTDIYDTSDKLRTPSYTDRIIYRCRCGGSSGGGSSSPPGGGGDSIRCLGYQSIPPIRSSDHKPVYALFRLQLHPGIPTVSPTGGFFHRKVYVAAMREEEDD